MRCLLFCFFTVTCLFTTAQNNFQSYRFSNALSDALKEGKLIWLQYESATCNQCNEVADKGMQDALDKMGTVFILLKISTSHPDRAQIEKLYNLSQNFGSLFIDANKNLVHSYKKSTTRTDDYLKLIDVALSRAGENLQVNELEKEYANGNRAPGFLELLLQKKKLLSLETALLLDEYAGLLPADSLQSTYTLKFLAAFAPLLDSKADAALRKNQNLFNRAWYSLPKEERSLINSQIIYRSMQKAIREKNEKYALRVGYFAQSTHMPNYEAGSKSYESNMLHFYKETGDTAKYFARALAYYDRFFMGANLDSVARFDSINKAKLLREAIANDTRPKVPGMPVQHSIAMSPRIQMFTRELNNGAWDFYLLTKNPYLLAIATTWAKTSVDYFSTPEAWNTYAHLLYGQKQTKEAIAAQQKSVNMKKQRGFNTKEAELILDKMQKGLPIETTNGK